jgi:hypothetical protein
VQDPLTASERATRIIPEEAVSVRDQPDSHGGSVTPPACG